MSVCKQDVHGRVMMMKENIIKNKIEVPGTKEINGIVYFQNPFEIKASDWYEMHEDSDFIADELENRVFRIYCYSKDLKHNANLEKVRRKTYSEKAIYSAMSNSLGGIWL